ncbi:MAG: alpha/beta hydrolase [Candidatus Omnitrophica bacterium]|nr:alpha/beta hydrolase [Candidatus Omnitrophota bacterium]MDD5546975.1 alpha/beta hydrolase [Candidatus Omnitrophota bacterium]
MFSIRRPLAALFLVSCLTGCAAQSFFLEKNNGFTKNLIRGRNFTLLSYITINRRGEPLVIYIEGDGLAWRSRSRPSSDPTPTDRLVMRLASLDPSPNVAYLARPGQYVSLGASQCDAKYWTAKRFSPEVIKDMDLAVSRLRDMAGARSVSLVGYSGGGAVAVLVAARRDDVISLRTIAGNLDWSAVSDWNKVSPLNGSLNPIDYAAKIRAIPQRHFVASGDRTIPASVAKSFAGKTGDDKHESITVVKGTTHHSGWEDKWRKLLDMPLSPIPKNP